MLTFCFSLSSSFSAAQSSLVLKTQLGRNGPPPWASAGTRASISQFWLAFIFVLTVPKLYHPAKIMFSRGAAKCGQKN